PFVGLRNPAKILRSVVLPQPLCPTTQVNVDASAAKLTSRSATTVRDSVSYWKLRWRTSIECIARSAPGHPHHAPAPDRPSLDGLEDEALEAEPEEADDDEGAEHHVGPEKFLRVEDHPAEPPGGRCDHLAADDGDPRPGERLAQSGDDERERPRQHDLLKQVAAARAHGFGGTDPDTVDRAHAGPRVEHDRERRRVEDQRDARRVAQAEPEDEDGDPGQR